MKDRIEWTRMVSDCITGYRSARGDADAMPPRSFIRAWMNRNFGLQKIPGRLFRLFCRSDKEELNEAFRAGNQARKKESAADAAPDSFEELHYSDIPVLNTQMNRLRNLVSPEDVKNIGGDAISFYVDMPCDFEFYFNISIYPLEKTGIYSIHVMFSVEGLETYMYDGDEVDSQGLEYVFDRIVDAVEHP